MNDAVVPVPQVVPVPYSNVMFPLPPAITQEERGDQPSWRPTTGPGDLSINSSIVAWWGFRCYSSTYTGNVAAITDTHASPSSFTMSCSSGSLVATNGSGGTISTLVGDCVNPYCTVTTMYDQSGKNSCAGSTACDLIHALAASKLFSNCPSFTTSPAFCISGTASGWFVTANALSVTTAYTESILAYPSSAASEDNILGIGGNGTLFLKPTRYRYYEIPGYGLAIDTGPSGWGFQSAADPNSASLNSYMQINSGRPQTGLLSTFTLKGIIYVFGGVNFPDGIYLEEAGIWSADIRTSLVALYSNASLALGGF